MVQIDIVASVQDINSAAGQLPREALLALAKWEVLELLISPSECHA
jgi:hypothetical protein